MHGLLRKLSVLFCAMGMWLMSGGVYAMSNYIMPPKDISLMPLLGLDGFYYKKEEVLPGDYNNQMNAYGLFDYIVNNVKIGLNSSIGDRLLE